MKKTRLRVTDHAVICYLERVKGLDVEAIRREIGHAVQAAEDHPDATGVNSGGFSYRISGSVVVTVCEQNRPDLRCGRQRGDRAND